MDKWVFLIRSKRTKKPFAAYELGCASSDNAKTYATGIEKVCKSLMVDGPFKGEYEMLSKANNVLDSVPVFRSFDRLLYYTGEYYAEKREI